MQVHFMALMLLIIDDHFTFTGVDSIFRWPSLTKVTPVPSSLLFISFLTFSFYTSLLKWDVFVHFPRDSDPDRGRHLFVNV